MKRLKTFAIATALIAAPLLILPLVAHAQIPPTAQIEGKAVYGQGDALLGHVERVIRSASGAPAQVLVRPAGLRAGGPRSVSFKALQPRGDDLTAPLSKPEFDAMPAVTSPSP